MHTVLIEIRRAKLWDAAALAATHDEAWRTAYRGIIPGPELDKLVNRRGAEWWEGAIRKGEPHFDPGIRGHHRRLRQLWTQPRAQPHL